MSGFIAPGHLETPRKRCPGRCDKNLHVAAHSNRSRHITNGAIARCGMICTRNALKKASRNIIAHALRPVNANAREGMFDTVLRSGTNAKRGQILRTSIPKMKYGKSAATALSWKADGRYSSTHERPTLAASATKSIRVLKRHKSGAIARTTNIAYANQYRRPKMNASRSRPTKVSA